MWTGVRREPLLSGPALCVGTHLGFDHPESREYFTDKLWVGLGYSSGLVLALRLHTRGSIPSTTKRNKILQVENLCAPLPRSVWFQVNLSHVVTRRPCRGEAQMPSSRPGSGLCGTWTPTCNSCPLASPTPAAVGAVDHGHLLLLQCRLSLRKPAGPWEGRCRSTSTGQVALGAL